MAYDLKSVFYLDQQFDIASGTAAGSETGKTMDISAYIDPVAKGRRSGVGLAIYKVHFDWSDTTGNTTIDDGEKGGGRAAVIVGDLGYTGTTATVAQNDFTLSNSNQNLIASQDFFGPLYGGASASPGMVQELEIQMPSTQVPYVAVRDTLNLVWGQALTAQTTTANISVRLECAQIKLDAAVLNQLLRTQTV
jgi:hypothetical protein